MAGAVLVLPATAHVSASRSVAPAPVVGAGPVDVVTLVVRNRPAADARVVGTLPDLRPSDFRPQYVLAIGKARSRTGVPWYRIPIPGRPNGRTGWVRATDVSVRPIAWQVVVLRESRRIQVWKGSRLVRTGKVAVGAPGLESPLGLYYVTVGFKPVRQTFLGTYAFETSAYSKLSEWPGGGVVGLHGTWQPGLLGKAVSHGCIRVSNAMASFLRDHIPVGTPIRVVAR